MAPPAERFRLVPLAKGRASVPVDSKEDHRGQWVLRRVGSNGMVSVDSQLFSVTNAYKGHCCIGRLGLRRRDWRDEIAPM